MESTVVSNPTLIVKGFVSQLLHDEMPAPGGCADSADFDDQILHMISYYDTSGIWVAPASPGDQPLQRD
jgi:hypothetical protein